MNNNVSKSVSDLHSEFLVEHSFHQTLKSLEQQGKINRTSACVAGYDIIAIHDSFRGRKLAARTTGPAGSRVARLARPASNGMKLEYIPDIVKVGLWEISWNETFTLSWE